MKKSMKSSVIAILLMVVLIFSSTVAVLANSGELRIIEQPTNGYANLGQLASTTVLAAGDGLKYTWYVKDVSAENFVKSAIKANKYTVKMTESNVGRQLYCVITDSNGDSLTTDTVTLNLPPEIKITKQPENVQTPLGGNAKATVEATGLGIKYQWYVKDVTDTNFKKSAFASNTYVFKMTEEKDGRQAYCVITDKYGNSKSTDIITFSVLNIEIVKQPQNTYAALGSIARTSVEATGESLRYQWFVKDINKEEFVKSSITSNTYTYTMTEEKSGRQAYCVITDKYGNTVTTETVSFWLSNLIIKEQPKNVGVPNGTVATVSVKASGEELKYLWFVKDLGENGFTSSEIEKDEYTVVMNEEISGRQVYCEITDKAGNVVKSEVVVLVATEGVKIIKQPLGTHALIGATIKTTVEATGDELTYKWYVKDPGDSEYKLSSIRANTYVFQMTEGKNGRQVYCVITDKYGNSATSEIALLRKTTLKITKQPYHTSGTIGKTIKTVVNAEGEGLTYTWYLKNPGSTTFTKSSIKANSYSFTLSEANSGRQVYCVVTDKYGKTVKSNTVTLKMK